MVNIYKLLIFFCFDYSALLHTLLLDLMVNYMAFCKLCGDIVNRNAGVNHQNGDVIEQVGDFKNRLFFIAALCRDYDLGAFLADLFEDFVNTLFKKVGGI